MDPLEEKMDFADSQDTESHSSSSSCFDPHLEDMVLNGKLDRSTALLLACEEGHLDVVQRIVEVCGADVRAAANFYFSGEEIEGATPIFVAALKRHDDIVRYLISRNVDVNAITSTKAFIPTEKFPMRCLRYCPIYEGVSPLEAALEESDEQSFDDPMVEKNVTFRLLLEAGANPSTLKVDGNPMWYGCDVYSVIELIKHDINLDLRSTTGDTILHDWINSASLNLDIIDKEKFFVDGVYLLLAYGIDLTARNNKGFTPIVAAAAELKGPSETLFGVLDLLLKKDEIDASEKIDAMELAGARLLLASEPEKASHYWKKALDLRRREGRKKIPLQTSGQAIEWETLQQLEDVIQDKSMHWIQAALAGLRIYASKGLEAVLAFLDDLTYLPFIREEEEAAKMTQISNFCLEILGVFLRFDPYLCKLLGYKARVIEKLTNKLLAPFYSSLRNYDPLLNFEREKINLFLQLNFARDPDELFAPFHHDFKFFRMLAGVPDLLQRQDIREYLSELVRQDGQHRGGILLFEAYDNRDWKTLRFLLHLRADPNTTMIAWGSWPRNKLLHLAAEEQEHPMVLTGELEREQISLEMECTPAHLFFDYGAQPHLKNDEGKTAVDIWIEKNCGVEGVQSPKWKNRPYWCRNSVPKLGCLAAKTIHTNGIPYSRRPGDLPVKLLHLLDNH